ncbi:MAG: ABC transporter permease, partial [Bacteroidota bacterium]
MFDRDKWQEILGTIRKNKLRTFLTALGVFWGIFMLVFLLGMGKGLENGVFKDFGSRAKNVMGVYAWRTSLPYDGLPAGRRIRLKMEDLSAIERTIDEVDKVAPRFSLGNMLVSYGAENSNYELRGEFEAMIDIEALVLRSGRYINKRDIEESRKVVVIGDKVKEVLFGDEDPLGKHILIQGLDFKVIG